MARDFEDHCWKDIIDADTMQIYQAYRRKIYVGDNPAVLAIDLYNKAYLGGDRPVKEVDREFSGSCGENAWKAMAPTQKLFAAARRAGVPIIYTTRHVEYRRRALHQPQSRPQGGRHLRHQGRARAGSRASLVIYKERASGLLRHAADRAPAAEADQQPDHLRRKHVRLRARLARSMPIPTASTTWWSRNARYDRSPLSHKVNLFDLHHKYADVMHIEEVLAHLDGLALARKVA